MSESEYFTGDTSIDIHLLRPTIKRLVSRFHKWCESSDRLLRTFSRGYYWCRECIPIPNGVWEETVFVHVSSSIWHLKCHWMLNPTVLILGVEGDLIYGKDKKLPSLPFYWKWSYPKSLIRPLGVRICVKAYLLHIAFCHTHLRWSVWHVSVRESSTLPGPISDQECLQQYVDSSSSTLPRPS